jgi:hypothetical protein
MKCDNRPELGDVLMAPQRTPAPLRTASGSCVTRWRGRQQPAVELFATSPIEWPSNLGLLRAETRRVPDRHPSLRSVID